MKLLQELLSLREEAIETVKAADLWKEHTDDTKTFIPSSVFLARPIDGSDGARYEIFRDKDGTRKSVGKMDSDKFGLKYVPLRANQKEDAEGFKAYREDDDVEAFKHADDTIKVDLEGQVGKLTDGDYLVRRTEGDNFVYSISKAETFEDDYSEEK